MAAWWLRILRLFCLDLPEGGIVDLGFAGEEFEFMYILTKQNLYKLEGKGKYIPIRVVCPNFRHNCCKTIFRVQKFK